MLLFRTLPAPYEGNLFKKWVEGSQLKGCRRGLGENNGLVVVGYGTLIPSGENQPVIRTRHHLRLGPRHRLQSQGLINPFVCFRHRECRQLKILRCFWILRRPPTGYTTCQQIKKWSIRNEMFTLKKG